MSNANTNTKSEKIVHISIPDDTGHTTLEQKIEEAVQTVVKQHYGFGKWPFVQGNHFQFTAKDTNDTVALLEDTIRLKQLLDESDGEPIIVLTADLQGGEKYTAEFKATLGLK